MTGQMMKLEVRDELLAMRREPATLFFSVLMPVLFFAMFIGLFGPEGATDASIIAPYGTFAVLAVVMLSPGIGLADARDRGWLRVKRVSGIPLSMTLLAKVIAAVPYAVAVLLAITVVAVFVGGMTVDVGTLLRVFVVLVLGAMPFALFSLAVGALAGTTASAAILNAILMPMVILSGLWFPHEIMPEWVVSIGEFMPTYHLAQLAMVQVEGGAWLGHLAVLGLTAVVGATVAALTYRSARP
ncbi:MAG: ABC transporter permease [Bauldia sp.]|nr:ABC transporter permease [Bauldia sp.]